MRNLYFPKRAIGLLFFLVSAIGFMYAAPGQTCGEAISLTMTTVCSPANFTSTNHSGTAGIDCEMNGFPGNANDEMWFSFTALSTTATVFVDGGTDYDPYLFVYTSCGGSIIECSDANFGNGSTETINLTGLTLNATYYIWVYDWPIDGGNFDICVYDANVPLPVELTSFTAKATSGKVLLNWATASELNNDYFSIEKSINGTDFFAIGQVNGNGTTLQQQLYAYTDAAPGAGDLYYRLKQVDFDGTFAYSDIVAVSITETATSLINIFPNPSQPGQTQVSVLSAGSAEMELKVYNLLGQLKYQQIHQVSAGNQILRLPNMPAGVWLLETTSNGNRMVQEFIVK